MYKTIFLFISNNLAIVWRTKYMELNLEIFFYGSVAVGGAEKRKNRHTHKNEKTQNGTGKRKQQQQRQKNKIYLGNFPKMPSPLIHTNHFDVVMWCTLTRSVHAPATWKVLVHSFETHKDKCLVLKIGI